MMLELTPYLTEDRLFFILIALLANWLFGSHVFLKLIGASGFGVYLRRLLENLERKLNRSSRADTDRAWRGVIVIFTMILLTSFVAIQLSALTATHPWGWVAEVVLLALFIPQRQIWEHGKRVFKHLKKSELKEAREAVSRFSLRDVNKLDDHSLIRTTGEYICSALADRVVSPILWYIALGLPGFIASKILTTAAELLGYESKRHRAYGLAAGKGEAIINWLPSKLSVWLVAAAAFFVPKSHPLKGLKCAAKQAGGIHLPLKGGPIAAAAGALDIQLGGPRSVQNFLVKDEWVGSGTAKAPLSALRKIMLLYVIACLLILILIATLLLILG